MNKANLTALLKTVKAMIMRERVAYKDYLGEETVTRLLISGTLPDGDGLLTLEDATFTGFVVGETYQVTIDGQTTDCVAALRGKVIIVSVGDINSGNTAIVGFVSGNAIGMSDGEYVGKSITVSQAKTTKKYRTKKLPTELLPDGLAKSADVSKVAAAARNAQTTAEAAQTTAEAVEDAVSPHSRNYYAALFSKKNEYTGWWSTLPELEVNTTTGFVYKDAWSTTNPLDYGAIPQNFVVSNIYIDGKKIYAVLGCTVFGVDEKWVISGVGISRNGKIYTIETNKIPTSQSSGFVFTFTERDDTILSTPQTLTDAQKQQARANIGLTPVAKTDAMTQSVGLDADTGKLWTKPDAGSYTLPVASPTQLGGVKPVAKTDAMTRGVGVDTDGGLYTEPDSVFYIDLAGDYPNYTCPVAMADIKAAYEAGKELKCLCAIEAYTVTLPLFMPMPSANAWLFSGSGALTAMGFPAQSLTVAIVNGTVQASNTLLAQKDDIPNALPNPYALVINMGDDQTYYDGNTGETVNIPTTLPNPNTLTIKVGDTTTTYDGSAAVTIDIPNGDEVAYG